MKLRGARRCLSASPPGCVRILSQAPGPAPLNHLPAPGVNIHTIHCFHNEISPNVPQGPLVSGAFSPFLAPSFPIPSAMQI